MISSIAFPAHAITWPSTPSGEVTNGKIGDWADEVRGVVAPNAVDGATSIGVGASIISTDAQGRKSATVSPGLTFDVEGKIGAIEYCDKDGGNCFTAASVATLVGGGSGTDDQQLTLVGDNLTLEDGGTPINLATYLNNYLTTNNYVDEDYITNNRYVNSSAVCSNGQILSYDGTSSEWDCVDPTSVGGNTDDQNLTLTGTSLSIEDGNAVELGGVDGVGTDDQALSLAGTTLTLEDGGTVNLAGVDGVGTDDQDLTFNLATNILSLEGDATTVDLSSLAGGGGTDDQNLTLTGTSLSIEDGNAVELGGVDGVGTDDQALSLSGTTLTLEDGGTVNLSGVDGVGTDDQALTLTGDSLSLEDGGAAIDLSGYLDNTDAQDLTLAGTTLSLTGDGTSVDLAGVDGVGTDDQDLTFNPATNILSLEGDATTVDLTSLAGGGGTDDQNLTLTGTSLSIEDGNAVELGGVDGVGTDDQALTLTGDSLSLEDGGAAIDLSGYLDNTDAQDLALSVGGILSVTGDPNDDVDLDAYLDTNNYINPTGCTDSQIPQYVAATSTWNCVDPGSFSGDTDDQTLSLDGTDLTIVDGNTVSLASINTDAQDLTLAGTTLSLTGDGTSVDLSGVDGIGTDDQALTLTGDSLSLEDGGAAIDLSGYLDNTDAQDLTLAGTTLSLTGDGTSVDLSGVDGVGTDDQALSLSGTTLTLEDGGTPIDLGGVDGVGTDDQDLTFNPATNILSLEGDATTVDLTSLAGGGGTDDQNLTLTGTSLSIEDGNAVELGGVDGVGTDDQALTLTGDSLSLEDGGAAIDLSGYLDNTDAQDLTLAGTTLSLTGDGTSVDLSGVDGVGTDDQALSLSGTTLTLEDGGTPIDLGGVDGVGTDDQDWSEVANGVGVYADYRPNNVACTNGQVLEYDATNARWECGDDDTGSGGDGISATAALSIDGADLQLTDGTNTTTIALNLINTDDQALTLTGDSLSLEDGGAAIDLSGYLDNTDAQDLTLAGTTLSLTGDGTSVDLSGVDGIGTDDQALSLSGTTLTLEDGGTPIDLGGVDGVGTDNQQLTLTGDNLSLEDGGAAIDLSGYLDNTDAQDLTLAGSILSLTGDATTVDLSSLGGNDNLGNHVATQVLAMAGQDVDNAGRFQLSDEGTANTGANQWQIAEQSADDDIEVVFGSTGEGFTMDTDGNMDVTGYVNTSSDRKFKTNITTASGLSIVSQLRGVTFDWKKSGEASLGVIAQEVEDVVPALVHTRSNGDKSVNYDGFAALLIESIKELKQQNELLQQRVEALEADAQ